MIERDAKEHEFINDLKGSNGEGNLGMPDCVLHFCLLIGLALSYLEPNVAWRFVGCLARQYMHHLCRLCYQAALVFDVLTLINF